jgi:predicted transcriptional regulator
MFSNSRKLAQHTAQRLIAGHTTLLVWWALKHAGVFDGMQKLAADSAGSEGLDPLVYATRANMAPDVLKALLDYLATTGLLTYTNQQAALTPEGAALLEHEDSLLELLRSYEPVLDLVEHLLARLKTPAAASTLRKTESVAHAQSQRYAAEVYPAVAALLDKHNRRHVLDLTCGSADLLLHLAQQIPMLVGVGLGADGFLVRRGNDAINAAALDKRLIAVTANPVDACLNTQRVFDRIGISRQLWGELDCLLATHLAGEPGARDAEAGLGGVVKMLAAIPKNFPKAHLLLIEPTASARFDKNYYAPELALAMRLCNAAPWTIDQWRQAITQSKLTLLEEVPLTTEGITLFLCAPK